MRCAAESQDTLDDTARRQHAQERSEYAGNNADECVERGLLFVRAALALHFAEAFEVSHRKNCVVHVRDVLTDNDLILSARL